MRRFCLSAALLVLLVILVDSTPLNIHHIQDEGPETNHTQELETCSVVNVVKSVLGGVITGTKIIGNGASVLTGLAEIINKALKGQVMISGIQFDNHTQEELPMLEIEYSTLSEEIKGVETIHKQGIEKRAVLPVVKGILGGVLKGVKIFGKGASILTGLAEIVKKALKGQVMISGIQFDNHMPEELPTLEIEYSTLSEENEGVKTSHKHGLEKRSIRKVFKKILGGVIKGSKIVGKGASILGGLAKILNKTMKDEVMISRIQFYNHTQEELPTLEIEYTILSEENKGVETSHKQKLEKRAVLPVLKGILGGVLKGAKIFGKGASILTGLAEIVKKALKGQVMISGIQFDNSTQEEMPTLQIEYSTLIEENEGVETIHKQGIEKRSVLPVVKGILGGMLKGVKIFGQGASILTGLAEIIKKALKGQVMISGIQFDNSTREELPTLEIEYATLSEEITGVETIHKQGIEKRSVKGILSRVLKGVKIFGKGASILTRLAEIIKKALKGQVMISGIQFDNNMQEEMPTLQVEYSTLIEENKGVETSQKRVLEKRSVVHVVKSILGGVIKGTKIFGKGASILTGLAEIVKKALKGQVMISRIQFDNHTQEELPTLNMEYSALNEENKVSPAFMPAFCMEPKFVGVCKASMTRYFYNAQTGHCELFVYSGCGGNENNFPTLEECMKTCYPKAQSL
ncbi:trophoblast Kunitz domain protein 1 isoform X3 [Bubalus bubalis]|uniref:trophoblast Kunitz domain protein 1 isoform X3 n=1 Tax=Bubalus bubalis TaxID=89462 RepID=UPI001E1B7809|nr:trophoblast Kunitz domain protein 1 isoform X3 [Bubalus bubalis]